MDPKLARLQGRALRCRGWALDQRAGHGWCYRGSQQLDPSSSSLVRWFLCAGLPAGMMAGGPSTRS